MSNPVTNADIEDVLSSIRRLVSEEARPKVAPPTVATTDRLVLTPALRVMDSEPPQEEVSDQGDSAPELVAIEDQDTDAPANMPTPELVEAHEVSGLTLDEVGKRNLEARIAELEAVISESDGQWEQDGELGGANAGGPVGTLDWQPDGQDADPVDAAPHADAPPAEDSQPATDVADMTVLSEHLVTETELEVVRPEDADPTPGNTASEPEFTNSDQDVAQSELEAEPSIDGPDPVRDFLVDEALLRELVADIVRQELQGPLGERITRNVRKLVRREIMRALTSQELE